MCVWGGGGREGEGGEEGEEGWNVCVGGGGGHKDHLLLVYIFGIYRNVLQRFCIANVPYFHEIWGDISALVVLYVFKEVFISNKFEVTVRILGIQSKVNVSVSDQYEIMLSKSSNYFFLNGKICFLYQIEEIQHLSTYRRINPSPAEPGYILHLQTV